MKNKKALFVLIIFLIFIDIKAQDSLIIKENHLLSNGLIFKNPQINSVIHKKYAFNGYLIIELDKNFIHYDSTFYYCRIFYVDKLNDLLDTTKHILYDPTFNFYITHKFYTTKSDSLKNLMDNFSEYYTYFNRANYPEVVSFMYSANDDFKTDLLKESSFFTKNGKYYAIFKLSFFALKLNLDIELVNKEKIIHYTSDMLIPVSKLLDWSNFTDETILNDFGLSKENLNLLYY
jgi:hypothetical protein